MLAQLVWVVPSIIVVVLVTFAVGLVIRHVCPSLYSSRLLSLLRGDGPLGTCAQWDPVQVEGSCGTAHSSSSLLRLLFSPAATDEGASCPGATLGTFGLRGGPSQDATLPPAQRRALLIGTDFRCAYFVRHPPALRLRG